MDWKQQFKNRDLRCRDTSIILLLLAFNLLLLIFSWSPRLDSETVSAAGCADDQRWIYRIMGEVPDGEEFELPPEWTVADLIREAVRIYSQTSSHPLPEETFTCRNVRYVRVFPYLRRQRTEVNAPYLVFPVPASVVFDESLPPVPILMCPPGAHGTKHGSIVLYSNGSTRILTPEEAEKLVAEKSPVPLEINRHGD